MKVCIIADTHWGIKGDSVVVLDYLKKSVDEFLMPLLKSQGIKKIIHLGDLVDRRKYINIYTAKRLREDFLEPINKDFEMDMIIGNHDTFFKNTNTVNSSNEILQDKYSNIKIISEPTVTDNCIYLPWVCEENKEYTLKVITEAKREIIFGHLEIQGFEMQKGRLSDHGFDKKIFNNYDYIFSGHFHHKSVVGNINYVGAFTEHNWSDFDGNRGVHIFDFNTRELTFFKNPFTLHHKIFYDDRNKTLEELMASIPDIANKVVKVIVQEKTNPYFYDLFIQKLEEQDTFEIQTVEDHKNIILENDEDILEQAEDTLSLFKSYITHLDVDSEQKKNKLENTIFDLYKEANNLRV
jgi:DNA repair exonuclease SbcCD nuclease subunit